MIDFLSELAALTLGGSAAVIVLALTARLSRARYAARWRCWLWLLLCIRLTIPVSIQLPEQVEMQSPIQITVPGDPVLYTYQAEISGVQQPEQHPQDRPDVSSHDEERPGPSNPVQIYPRQEITLYQILFAVWAVGVAAVLFWYGLSHRRFLHWLSRCGSPVVNSGTIRMFNELGDKLGLNARPRLLLCTGLRVPVLVGLTSPKLLLPEGEMDENALHYSLLHELTHFKRRDIWLKTLALWVNAIHWFNPLMWYMTRLVERDTELACDEAALKMLAPEEHSAYGRTLLDAVERLNV